MKARFLLSAALLICLMAANLGPVVAQAPNPDNNPQSPDQALATSATRPMAALPWAVQMIDSQNNKDLGGYASIAFDPGNGIPYISYYDATAQTLKLASPAYQSNCGPNKSWWCRTVESKTKIGRYSSIAIYRNNSTFSWKLGVAYIDDNTGGLRFAEYACQLTHCFGWNIANIEQLPNITLDSPSLKYGSDGVPQIAFHASQWDLLLYAKRVNSGGGCTNPAWQCVGIVNGGKYNSLVLTSSNVPAIAFYDDINKILRFAQLGSVAGFTKNCGPDNNTWTCLTIDAGSDTGLFPSMVYNAGVFYIAYYNKTLGNLKLAQYTGGNGNCGLSSINTAFEWQCNDFYNIGANLISHVGISMSLDATQKLVIAFMDAHEDQGPSTLVVARPITSYPTKVTGNCGIKGIHNIYLWKCQTLDTGGQYSSEAEYSSVAISPNGLAYVAYSEWDDYNNKHSLKVAFQQMQFYLPAIKK